MPLRLYRSKADTISLSTRPHARELDCALEAAEYLPRLQADEEATMDDPGDKTRSNLARTAAFS
jgi:hypothetical protein